MKLSCFDHNYRKNGASKRLYKTDDRPTRVTQMTGPGDITDWIDKRGQTEETPEWVKAADRDKVELTASVETTKSLGELPRPVTPGAKETLRIRTQKEIFGTKECQEWYIKSVREAIEKLDPDRLYDFIKAHNIYNKEGFSRWNSEFAALLSLNV
ncbi:hypothetical protein KJ657_00055, partial [Patescibacteria group bacterium]|nr:hypothetical protein [Patescibacteria group bacterium]MBU1015470.1 hypothetical protein [Patescibacteria group bacterium]MBU1685440.1 hypothetical protein [Patescibacteria group bacterium]MBU1938718.1 hypothetical protein [Patescibacteria group bacterium]